MAGKYDKDIANLKHYYDITGNQEEVKKYLDKWVYNVKSHEEYCDVVGKENLTKLLLQKA